eukprot:jgi/Undpi1/1557/HiC_scaffold_11.g04947.m1
MLAPSARVMVRWPSAVSLSDSSHGAGNRGSLSPSLPRVGALNVFRAAETGDVEVMLTYLNGGGEPNKTGKSHRARPTDQTPYCRLPRFSEPRRAHRNPCKGYSVLHLAAMRNQAAMVELLLERGADPDAHDVEEGLTPLMWAAQLGYTKVAALLLEWGAGTEQEDLEDLTALHWAARLGQESVVHLLLDHAADIEAVDYDGNTPLIWSAREGHRGCVNILLDNEASTMTPDENGNTALHFSCQNGHAGITSDLLDWGALVTAQDYWQFTPFHRACSQGHGDVLVELLRARAPEAENTNDGRRKGDGRGGFGSGSRSNGGREVAGGGGGGGKRRGGGRRGDESLYPSVGLPSEIIDLRNHFHATPLHRAAAKGHEEVVSMLVQNGSNVNARDGFFYTPLHLACVNGTVACVDVLLRSGADPTTRAQGGVTPLLAARKPEIRELLNNFLPAWTAADVVAASYTVGVDGVGEGSGGGGGGGSVGGSGDGPRNGRRGASGRDSHTKRQGRIPSDQTAAAGKETAGSGVVSKQDEVAVAAAPTRGVGTPGVACAVSVIGNGGAPVAAMVPKVGAVNVRSLPVCAAAAAAAAAAADGEQSPVTAGGLSSPTAMDVCEESEALNVDRTTGLPAGGGGGGGDGRPGPVERGRPMSRLPRDEAAIRRRLRRSSTGSMLQKVFSHPQFPTWPSGGVDDDASPTGLIRPARLAEILPKKPLSTATPTAAWITATTTPTPAVAVAAAPVGSSRKSGEPHLSPCSSSDPVDTSSVPSAAPPRRSLARLTVKNPDLFRGTRRLSDAGAEAGVAAAAVVAAAAFAVVAAAAAGGEGGLLVEGERRTYKKRRARSLPPCWEGDKDIARRRKGGGEQPRPPRRPRLGSRPCMDGPAAVIANLALDEGRGNAQPLPSAVELVVLVIASRASPKNQ